MTMTAALTCAAIACGRANSGPAAETRGADSAGFGGAPTDATSDPSSAAAMGTTGPRPTILPLPTATPPTLPPGILAPILANTARQPFPVSPACAGYTFENAESDTTAAHVQRGWASRCKAVLEEARKDLAVEYPAFTGATVEVADDKASDGSRLAGSVMLALPSPAPGSGARGSALYTIEWTYARKNLGPYCPFTPARKKNAGPEETYAVSLQRYYRIGSGLLRLDGFASDTVSSVALKLEAAMDRCAAIARRGT